MFVLYLLILFGSACYLWMKFVYSYWSRTKFPYLKPNIPFGNMYDSATGKQSMGINLYELHKSSSEPIIGIYLLFRPALLVRDADLAKNMLTTDFANFYDRGIYHNPRDPVADHMLMLPGQEWKQIRSKLTPTFTSGKLKGMMPAILQIAEVLKRKLLPSAQTGEIVEVKDLMMRYALDVIGTVGFGLDVNTIDDVNHSFREIEKRVNNGEFINRIRLFGAFLCPKILEVLHMSSLPKEFKEFMINIVQDTMEFREKNHVKRKDFIQLLMELRKPGKLSNDNGTDTISNDKDSKQEVLTLEQCAAQVALFYLAGFDTSSSAVSFCLFELSRQPELMKRVQCEIDDIMNKYTNNITYECINEMPFLDACVRETVRKYPTLPFLNRICTKDYKIPSMDLTISNGTPIIISLLGIMRDPTNFPHPEQFLPDRYDEENPKYNPSAFIPFGDGPRSCIGMRMGKMVAKIALISLLQNYSFICMDDRELEFDNYSVTLVIKGGINLKVINRWN